MEIESLFFELLRVAIGRGRRLSRSPSDDEWEKIYRLCERHALTGIGYVGIGRVPCGQWPSGALTLKWTALSERIVSRNNRLNKCCMRICRNFERDGFFSCILKGQSNNRYYPTVCLDDGNTGRLGMYRMPGDVDVWVKPLSSCGRPISRVVKYVYRFAPGVKACYHHVDFPVMKDTEIEVHYRPAFLCSPLRNHRLQKWFDGYYASGDFERFSDFTIPDNGFNIVFQLVHIYKHLFEEGIGLRQMLDYYFVVVNYHDEAESRSVDADMYGGHAYGGLESLLKYLGLHRFASAVMYVLHEVFGLPEEYMLVPMDMKEGRFLLDEIMLAGNFGHYDDRIKKNETTAERAFRKLRRNFRFVRSYPEEVLCEPFFRVYHWMWRTLRLWRLE